MKKYINRATKWPHLTKPVFSFSNPSWESYPSWFCQFKYQYIQCAAWKAVWKFRSSVVLTVPFTNNCLQMSWEEPHCFLILHPYTVSVLLRGCSICQNFSHMFWAQTRTEYIELYLSTVYTSLSKVKCFDSYLYFLTCINPEWTKTNYFVSACFCVRKGFIKIKCRYCLFLLRVAAPSQNKDLSNNSLSKTQISIAVPQNFEICNMF